MLLVGESQASSIIRRDGSTIKVIQEKSGAMAQVHIHVEDIPCACALVDDKVLEIQGDPTKIHEAMVLVVSHLKEFFS
jgi:hypothetical protein